MVAVLILALGQNFPEMPQFPAPTDAALQSALKIYREYNLPLPPRGSQFVKFPVGESSDIEGNTTIRWSIGFRLPGAEARVLSGLSYLPLDDQPYFRARLDQAVPVGGDEAMALRGSRISPFMSNFESDLNLAIALQLAAMGDVDLAKHFASGRPVRYVSDKSSIEERTYQLVAKYYLTRYADKDGNVPQIARALTEVRDQLDSEHSWNWLQMQVDAVIAAQRPFNSRPGSDERLVDELVYFGSTEKYSFWEAEEKDRYFTAILARGIAIVPTLIDHLEDKRATRQFSAGQMNGVDNFVSIQSLCNKIVGSLMSSRQVNRGIILRDQDPEEWWASVKGQRETDVLKRAIFFHEEDAVYDRDVGGNVSLNRIPLEIFKLRYPAKIPDLYLESLEHTDNTNSSLAYIIEKSDLSDKRKADLFRAAIDRGSASHKSTATQYLKKYDKDSAREALRQALGLDAPFGKNEKDHQASSIARQVLEIGDEEMVKTLVKKAMKEDSGVRVNVVSGIYDRGSKSSDKSLQLTALRLFLDDGSVHMTEIQRFESGDRSGAGAMRWDPSDLWGFENPISVRDYAAWCIGRLIEAPGEPHEDWRAEDWATYRGTIIDLLKKRDGGVISSHR